MKNSSRTVQIFDLDTNERGEETRELLFESTLGEFLAANTHLDGAEVARDLEAKGEFVGGGPVFALRFSEVR